MISFDTELLKKKFSRVAVPGYPDQEVYANLPDETEGRYQGVVIGQFVVPVGTALIDSFASAIPCDLIDAGTDLGNGSWRERKFKICAKITNPETGYQHGLSMLTPIVVYRYQDQIITQLVNGTHYTLSDSNTQINFVDSADGNLKDDADIRVLNVAYLDDDLGTFTGTPLTAIINIPDVLMFFMVCLGNVSTGKINIASFTFSFTSKQGITGTFNIGDLHTWSLVLLRGFHNEQIKLQAVIDTILFQNGLMIRIVNNEYTLLTINDATTISDRILTDIDITSWKESYFTDTIFNRIIVNYFHKPGAGQTITYYESPKKKRNKKAQPIESNPAAFASARNQLLTDVNGVSVRNDFGALLAQEREFVVVTYSDNAPDDVQAFADELYKRWGHGIWSASFRDISGTLLDAEVGDRIIICRWRSVHPNIARGKAFRIIDMTKNYALNVVDVHRADEIVT